MKLFLFCYTFASPLHVRARVALRHVHVSPSVKQRCRHGTTSPKVIRDPFRKFSRACLHQKGIRFCFTYHVSRATTEPLHVVPCLHLCTYVHVMQRATPKVIREARATPLHVVPCGAYTFARTSPKVIREAKPLHVVPCLCPLGQRATPMRHVHERAKVK